MLLGLWNNEPMTKRNIFNTFREQPGLGKHITVKHWYILLLGIMITFKNIESFIFTFLMFDIFTDGSVSSSGKGYSERMRFRQSNLASHSLCYRLHLPETWAELSGNTLAHVVLDNDTGVEIVEPSEGWVATVEGNVGVQTVGSWAVQDGVVVGVRVIEPSGGLYENDVSM